MTPPRCLPLGDSAFSLVFADRIDPEVHRRVLAVARRLTREPPRGVHEIVPAYTTIGVWFDPLERSGADLTAELLETAATVKADENAESGREWVIPVRYDGPDLDEVAARTGLSVAEVTTRHQQRSYRVYLLGFVPGFAFLGQLDPALELPRRTPPRQKVPAGSVAIAGGQTGIYPIDTPGGWHLIGRTSVVLFDPARQPPALLSVGDTVRFEAEQ